MTNSDKNNLLLPAFSAVFQHDEERIVTPAPSYGSWGDDMADQLLSPPPFLPQRQSPCTIDIAGLSPSSLDAISMPDLVSSPKPRKLVKFHHENHDVPKTRLRPRFQSSTSRRRRNRIIEDLSVSSVDVQKQQHGVTPSVEEEGENKHDEGKRVSCVMQEIQNFVCSPPSSPDDDNDEDDRRSAQSSSTSMPSDLEHRAEEKGNDVVPKQENEERMKRGIQCCQYNLERFGDNENTQKGVKVVMEGGIAKLVSRSLCPGVGEVLVSPSTSVARSA